MRWISAVLLVGLLAMGVAAQTSAQPKSKEATPSSGDALKIAGKTFEQWLKELPNKDPSKRETAIRMVCAFPPETAVKAVPALIVEFRRHTPNAPIDLSVRCNLCIALADLFGSGERIDPKSYIDAVQILRNQLRDDQAIVRYRAALALSAIGQEARAAVPDLIVMLKDRYTWEARQAAATALGSIAGDPKTGPSIVVLKNLYDVLGDNAYQVRLAAVQALSILGPPSAEKSLVDNYVNALSPVALKDPEPSLQIWARVAIIGATSDFSNTNLQPIQKHASSVDPLVRAQAVQAMGTIGPKAKSSVPTLIVCLNDSETPVQIAAMWALGRMEAAAVNALPILEKMMADPNQSDYFKRAAKESADKIKGR